MRARVAWGMRQNTFFPLSSAVGAALQPAWLAPISLFINTPTTNRAFAAVAAAILPPELSIWPHGEYPPPPMTIKCACQTAPPAPPSPFLALLSFSRSSCSQHHSFPLILLRRS
ncbi:hypothetical protein GOP47_0025702 [Adiantum capillus-veneris]|uniref:Uncharacterized protein n=1 Tax=Adiantum capillus-veneris TaxID=13818 RepID=A0A9D4U105_ADICA|nr:hypothetical protein GOP47_0025702 [Adiantum capillus-veneris]